MLAVLCLVAGLRDDRVEAATASDDRAATTPLLSARRMPFVFVDEVTRARFQTSLETFASVLNACIAVGDGTGTLATVNGDRALAPASTIKLLTAVAALQTLLAVTGICVGCRLYFLRWWVPSLFAQLFRRSDARQRMVVPKLVRVD